MQANAKSKQPERESDREGQATTNRKRPRRASKRPRRASDHEVQATAKSKQAERASDREEEAIEKSNNQKEQATVKGKRPRRGRRKGATAKAIAKTKS